MINGDVSLDFHIAVFCLVDVCVLKWVQRINISKIADYLLSGKKKSRTFAAPIMSNTNTDSRAARFWPSGSLHDGQIM